jgi:galactose mutarotase-like enzyme
MSDLESITLRSGDGRTEADFVPAANMLCSSLRHEGEELLDAGAGVAAYAEHGKTMGIPLLYPWANRLERFGYHAAGKEVTLPDGDPRIPVDPNGLPIHGVMPGLLRWQVDGSADDQVTARLTWNSDELLPLFPYRHQLGLEISVSDGALTIGTTVRASGEDALPVSFGYHPYLKVPGAPRQSWEIELDAFRKLILDERMIPTPEREPLENRSFVLGDTSLDDGFDGLPIPAEFRARVGGHGVRAGFLAGYPYAQVYAPPGHDFVCFEPMTAPANALNSGDGLQVVDPGHEYRAAFTIGVISPA